MTDVRPLPTNTVEIAERDGLDLDGWYVEAADAPMAPFEDENYPERTLAFFAKLLARSGESAAAA